MRGREAKHCQINPSLLHTRCISLSFSLLYQFPYVYIFSIHNRQLEKAFSQTSEEGRRISEDHPIFCAFSGKMKTEVEAEIHFTLFSLFFRWRKTIFQHHKSGNMKTSPLTNPPLDSCVCFQNVPYRTRSRGNVVCEMG